MLPFTLALVLSACAAPEGASGGALPPSVGYEASLTRLLQAVVTEEGLVDYDALAGAYAADFAAVLAAVERYDAATLTADAEKLAFFLNAYNVRMLAHVLAAPEVGDIEVDDRFGAFFRTPVRIAGMDVTLNQVENGILRHQDVVDGQPLPEGLRALRPSAFDPRVHVGLNCAAVSCPRLRREAFTHEAVGAQLDAALSDFADDARFGGEVGGTVILTALLDWFGEDFDASGRPAGDFFLDAMSPSRPGYAVLRSFLEGRDAATLRVHVLASPDAFFFYDWTVNRLK